MAGLRGQHLPAAAHPRLLKQDQQASVTSALCNMKLTLLHHTVDQQHVIKHMLARFAVAKRQPFECMERLMT